MTKSHRLAVSVACAASFGLAPLVATDAHAAAPAAVKKFSSCSTLLKVYKYGVASTKKAKGKTKATVSAAVYKTNKKLDADGDGIACDAGDLKADSSSSAGASAKIVAKTYKGSGDETLKLAIPAGGVAIAKIDFDGEDGVMISTLDADENVIDMPVSSDGAYSGTVLLTRGEDPEEPSDITMLDIVGEGDWTIKVSAASTAPLFDGDAKGSTDAVFRYKGEPIDLAVTHDGEDSFSVAVYDKDGILIERTVDEYGEIDDVYPMETGAYIVVRATAAWTIAED